MTIVGEIRTMRNSDRRVRITSEPDPIGNVSVMVQQDDGEEYVSVVPVDQLVTPRPTWRATHPELGNVTVDLPVDGNAEVRAVWSQAATDAATRG